MTINIPKCAQDGSSDYEAELAFVIGKTGRDISEDDALDYVLGYTASNDVSARDMQMLTAQWSFSKGLDGSCPIGKSLFGTLTPATECLRSLSRPCSRFFLSHQESSDALHQGYL